MGIPQGNFQNAQVLYHIRRDKGWIEGGITVLQ